MENDCDQRRLSFICKRRALKFQEYVKENLDRFTEFDQENIIVQICNFDDCLVIRVNNDDPTIWEVEDDDFEEDETFYMIPKYFGDNVW